jgi:hypothetical protein
VLPVLGAAVVVRGGMPVVLVLGAAVVERGGGPAGPVLALGAAVTVRRGWFRAAAVARVGGSW